MASESGYQNQKKLGLSQYKTIQGVGSDKYGENTAQMYLFDITPAPLDITNVDVDGTKEEKVWLEVVSHGARVGDVLRFTKNSDALFGWELEVIEVLDDDTLAIHNITNIGGVPTLPTIGEVVKVCRWITAKADSEGALTTSSGPVQFIQDGSTVTVNQDTSDPTNNLPLPTGLYIIKDGVAVPVMKDTGLPSNTVGVPVEIVAASGTPINITAGDINVQLSDQGINFDSLRVGDGSGIYIKVNADGSINVVDPDGTAALADILTAIEAGNVLLGTIDSQTADTVTELTTLNGVDFATVTKQDEEISVLSTMSATLDNLELISTSIEVNTLNTEQGITGLITSFDSVDFATQAKQDAIITELDNLQAQIPTTLGQKTSAASLAVTLASDQSSIPVVQGALTPSFQEDATVGGSVETFTAPAGAKWVKIYAADTNTANIRVKIAGTPTTTSGFQFQPGRSEDFAVAGNVSYISESSTGNYICVQYGA